ncbi:CDP-alcohol phosphatidyltransferase family protein [Candidatus Bathyarchaeota archaeon]|nr:CDP-alcohol phosphatidyltransferase family protein [Candidatus Bathyarchaeota archaeon]
MQDNLKPSTRAVLAVLVSSKLKKQFEATVTGIVKPLGGLGISPNHLTILGMVLAVVTSYMYTKVPGNRDYLLYAAGMFIVSGFIDAIDGVLARSTGKVTRFGGFLDSVADRYSDAIVYSGVIAAGLCNLWAGLLALFGSMLVSYARARAEMEGVNMAGIGLAERAERMIFLALCTAIAYWYPEALNYGITILAALAHFTVLQRSLHFKKEIERN